jgi:hypothetical protein
VLTLGAVSVDEEGSEICALLSKSIFHRQN